MTKSREGSPITPPRFRLEEIRAKAEEFRARYISPVDSVPVPIIEIAEFELEIQPIPIRGMKEKIDIEGFLTSDLLKICIDYDLYMDRRQDNRLRFTYGHEIGHLILHAKELQQCRFRTEDDWLHFWEDFHKEDLDWFEEHGREFAGRLLVPAARLLKEVEGQRTKINKFRALTGAELSELTEPVSGMICDTFKVSRDVIQKRIQREKIWEKFELKK